MEPLLEGTDKKRQTLDVAATAATTGSWRRRGRIFFSPGLENALQQLASCFHLVPITGSEMIQFCKCVLEAEEILTGKFDR